MKKIFSIQLISASSMGIALVILAQLLGKAIPAGAVFLGPMSCTQIVTGSVVNCVLFTFSEKYGMPCGVIIGISSSLLASVIGVGPAVAALAPAIALGNIVLCLTYGLTKNFSRIFSYIFAAFCKCISLWLLVSLAVKILSIQPTQAEKLLLMFSWPQGITALLGGQLAAVIGKRNPGRKPDKT